MVLHNHIAGFIQTKVYRPHIGIDTVERKRLFDRLDVGLTMPLTLVSAPAGYGKSTLVRSWLDHVSVPCAWLSLDSQDNNLDLFAYSMIAAVQTAFPTFDSQIVALLRRPDPVPGPALDTMFINDLSRIEQDYVLVLEDYHTIRAIEIHELLTQLLRHPPPSLHLILITRMDAPLPLARLRVRGKIVEIRADDLRFSAAETDDFLQTSLGITPDPAISRQLTQQTEGWAAGLRLMVHSIRRQPDVINRLRALRIDTRQTLDYFALEVFAQVPETTQSFLLKTAILDTVCASLGNAVLGLPDDHTNTHDILVSLWRSSLFVVSVDEEHQWYRYHALFRQFLQQQTLALFDRAERDELHLRACVWLEQRGFHNEALRHALAVEDQSVAAQYVIRNWRSLLDQEQWQLVERWLQSLPEATILQHPALLIARALIANNRSQWEMTRTYLHMAETRLRTLPDSPDAQALWGEIYLLRGSLLGWTDNTSQMMDFAEQAIERIPQEWRFSWVGARMVKAAAIFLSGEAQKAFGYLYRLFESEAHYKHTSQATSVLFLVGVLQWADFSLNELQATARSLLNLGIRENRPENSVLAHYLLGCATYNLNDLDAAISHLEKAIEHPYLVRTLYYVQAVSLLAQAYQAQGNTERALQTINTATEIVLDMGTTQLLPMLQAQRLDIALNLGQVAEAKQWVEQFDESGLFAAIRGHIPHFVLIKSLLIQNTSESREWAGRLLAEASERHQRRHNRRDYLSTLVLQTWLAKLQGDQETALSTLRQAVALVESTQGIRPFVDMMPVLGELLHELRRQGVAVQFVGAILTAATATTTMPVYTGAIEPLSDREIEIVHLLGEQLSNREISQHLYISVGTVKQHTHRIYRKLGVSSRGQAVRLARALKLI